MPAIHKPATALSLAENWSDGSGDEGILQDDDVLPGVEITVNAIQLAEKWRDSDVSEDEVVLPDVGHPALALHLAENWSDSDGEAGDESLPDITESELQSDQLFIWLIGDLDRW
jgi:hypothetical protein